MFSVTLITRPLEDPLRGSPLCSQAYSLEIGPSDNVRPRANCAERFALRLLVLTRE